MHSDTVAHTYIQLAYLFMVSYATTAPRTVGAAAARNQIYLLAAFRSTSRALSYIHHGWCRCPPQSVTRRVSEREDDDSTVRVGSGRRCVRTLARRCAVSLYFIDVFSHCLLLYLSYILYVPLFIFCSSMQGIFSLHCIPMSDLGVLVCSWAFVGSFA